MSGKKQENYLERIPMKNPQITYTVDENGLVTLEILNRGVFNAIAHKLFKRPKTSYIHLDENGSFVWSLIDGKMNILMLGEKVLEHFGDKAQPLYERLVKYFGLLDSYGFIKWENKQ